MKKISNYIVNHSLLIVIISLLLLIPAAIGIYKTKINYDILVYLPSDIDTVKGQNILTQDFKIGAFSFVITDSKTNYELLQMEDDIKKIDHVNQVLSIADVTDTTIPINMLPDNVIKKIYNEDSTVILVTFDTSTSDEETIDAVDNLTKTVKDSEVSSMTSMVLDTMNLSNNEIVTYVVIAVILCLIVLILATDSYLIPFLLLSNIGVAILYNMGTNVFLGEISYITKAISAVLQLGVTTDFSIFLYHKYEMEKGKDNKKAMNVAINETFKSVIGSSLTTIAGFLALCSMDLTLGYDIGIVMSKGVLFGLICVLTLFPSLLLAFDKLINKTKHKMIFPKFKLIQNFSYKHYKLILVVFLLLLAPAIYGNHNVNVYYKLDKSLPSNLPSQIASSDLKEKFNIVSPEIILLDKDINNFELNNLVSELEDIKGIDLVLAPKEIADLPVSILPDDLVSMMENDQYQIVILNSTYEIASNSLNKQVDEVNNIVTKYDKDAIIAGEGPLMKDLIKVANHDFNMVNYTSILVIFIIMLLVLKSFSLPVILTLVIEFAIFVNMSISYYFGVQLPFIASIVIGTIQLGATIDYAILMSTKYLDERKKNNKELAIKNTLSNTVPSIITSALCFFAATFGVAIYSKIDMIASLCNLLARGAIISMLVVILVLPAFLRVFDKLIMKTTKEVK